MRKLKLCVLLFSKCKPVVLEENRGHLWTCGCMAQIIREQAVYDHT